MSLYRLLRDNKESGPFTGEELLSSGFKPYDLLWVEGKSAGWRYPGEIAEFKEHVPLTEEQPFDRFYRKPSEENLVELSKEPKKPLTNAGQGRHIHVTLPSGNSVNVTTIVKKKEVQETATSFSEIIGRDASPESLHSPAPVAKTVGGFSWTIIAGLFTGIAALVGLGIMIGLSINRQKNDLAFNQAMSLKSARTEKKVNASPVIPEPIQTQETAPAVSTPVEQKPVEKPMVKNAVVKQKANSSPVTGSEIILPESEFARAMQVVAIPYKVGPFGGLTEVSCTIQNTSDNVLKSVDIELSYYLANDKVFKTETLRFEDIRPSEKATLRAPKSTRGTKIKSKIIAVRYPGNRG
ncbi:MAG: hypothetical protein H7Y27_05765 [Gemmatimonadaceae bacterium]|nr:hypothetical protein [Chitinophagaceae bacterium]